ncbi:uncharacterized protein LOC130565921 [Triplophysa rosa]|uniref:Coiled-coil domain-containing protein 190 n=1 Tax=Triplophysa rosa TaxID=992332 RepID=A0A9W7WHQ5_TRIRA|nr:uncharacterized protein LOC130565921 [Triplophysa rosa]XP_057209056.1 uncharacterized protein LOC130565921 [Triplophysa rosa]KAI7800011.1 hypothetical protein IRJ41_021142 [Triplophysa rosa]
MRRGDWLAWPGEAQRREERRTEARLAQGLQRLDQAKHYHLNSLTREQQRLHRDLISMKTGNPWKRGLHSLGIQTTNHDVGRPAPSYKRTLLPIIPLAGREIESHRSMKPQPVSSLQARVQEFISNGEKRAEHSTETFCLPDLTQQPVTSISTTTTKREESKEKEMDGEHEMQKDTEKEGRMKVGEVLRNREKDIEKEWMLLKERDNEIEAEINWNRCPSFYDYFPSEMLAPDGHLRAVHTLPNFAQALSEARKARYIRHRGQPLCERELTIREIFSQDPKDTPAF